MEIELKCFYNTYTISKNRQNCELCRISNGRTIPKFSNFWNFDSIRNKKENLNSKNFKLQQSTNFENDQIFEIVHFEKIMNFQNLTLKNLKKTSNVTIWKIWN